MKIVELFNKYKAKVILSLIVVLAFVMTLLYIKDLKAENKALGSETATTNENFKRLGDSYQAQGQKFSSEKAALLAAQEAQGKKLVDIMNDKDTEVRALFTANGELKAEIAQLKNTVVTPSSNGGFSVTLPQARSNNLPSLTSVSLVYNPTNKKEPLLGEWNNNKESFNSSIAEWQKKDNGYVATMKLTRAVYDASGKLIGIEEIPLTNATATFAPDAFGGEQKVNPVPRFTLYGGVGKDTSLGQNKVVSVLGIDYRFTTTIGLGGGVIGNTYYAAVSYRFGK